MTKREREKRTMQTATWSDYDCLHSKKNKTKRVEFTPKRVYRDTVLRVNFTRSGVKIQYFSLCV